MASEYTTIGHWIKRRRAELEWTQEVLAEEVACSTQTIHAIEGGQRRPSRDLAERIATVLQVPPDQRDAFVRLARGAGAAQSIAPAPSAPPVPRPDVSTKPAEPAAPVQDLRPRLPGAPNMLIGRQHEQNEIRALLEDASNRLITLVGPGGAGKSRLALQAAHDSAANFKDGAAWVALAPIGAPSQIAMTIASALGHTIGRSQSPTEEMIALVRNREMLLVLDNFEHLFSGIEILLTILQAAPRVRLLVTSRERLRLGGEAVIELDGLALPGDHKPATIVRSSAVLLFLERARQLDPSFALMPTNQTDVARICQLVHGMPLAIELAASWVRILSPAEILEEIERSLDFLELGGRDASARHQSLRAVFDYSWELLTAEEQEVLARLAVFRGGCSREAAKAVAHASSAVLAALVDKSLVRRAENIAGTSRFDLHEQVRQFAEARLRDAGQLESTRRAHLLWMLELAEDLQEKILQTDGARFFMMLETEQGNLRHALSWAIERRLVEPGLRLAGALKRFWFHQGYLTEGREWYDNVLQIAASDPPSLPKGRVLYAAGDFARWQGDYAKAIALLAESSEVYESLGQPVGAARSHLVVAGIALLRQEISRAIGLYEASLLTFRSYGDERGISQALNGLGNLLVTQGDFARAREVYEEQLDLVRDSGDATELSIALNNLGVVTRQYGELERARMLHEEALELSESRHSKAGIAWSTRNLGAVAKEAGDYEAAARYFKWSLVLRWEMRERAGLIWAAEGLAELAAAQGEDERAVQLWSAAAALTGPLPGTERSAEHLATERNIADVRARMDPDAFDKAWEAGQTMTMESVVHFGTA